MAAVALVLLLLPGLLVVRAPWTVVPALSLAFWTVTAWWPLGGGSRARFVSVALLASAALALLRLVPKHEVDPPAGYQRPPQPPPIPRPGRNPPPLREAGSMLVAAAATLLLAPALHWRLAPGPRLAFQTTSARLLLWRDAIPLSAEPLLPLAPFGAHSPALATLGADLSRLSGLDPSTAVAVLVVVAATLVLVGLFSVYATCGSPGAAAVSALVALALVPWPGWLDAFGAGEALLALAFLLPSCQLIVGHASRASAAAAGLLAGAGALAHPLLAAMLVGVSAAVVLCGNNRRLQASRFGAAAWMAAMAIPGLVPLGRAASLDEVAAALWPPPGGRALSGLALALIVVVLVPLVSSRLARTGLPRPRAIAASIVALVGVVVLAVRVHDWIGRGQLSDATLAALATVAAKTSPLDAVCAPQELIDWVPALAARAPGGAGPWIPVIYANEWNQRSRRTCVIRVTTNGDIVSLRGGKPTNETSVLIDGRGGATQPTR